MKKKSYHTFFFIALSISLTVVLSTNVLAINDCGFCWPEGYSWGTGYFDGVTTEDDPDDESRTDAEYLALEENVFEGWWNTTVDFGDSVTVTGLCADADVDSGNIDLCLANNGNEDCQPIWSGDGSGGCEELEVGGFDEVSDLQIGVKFELDNSNGDRNLTTLQHLDLLYTGVKSTCDADMDQVQVEKNAETKTLYGNNFSVRNQPQDCGGSDNTTVWRYTGDKNTCFQGTGDYDATVHVDPDEDGTKIADREYTCLMLCEYEIYVRGERNTWDSTTETMAC